MAVSLIVAAFLVFFNAINHPFVHDDIVFIVQNPQIAHLEHLGDIFLHPSQSVIGSAINSYYRPVLEIVYRLEYKLFRFNPSGYHLINILIHIANGLVLFALLSRLKFSQWFAFGVSLLFLIHPVQTEAVACIAGISNLLSTFLVLLTLYAYVREKYIWALLSFALALQTKEQVIVVPMLLILLDWYQQKKGRYFWWGIFMVMTAGFLALRAHYTGSHMIQDILASPGELRLRILAIPRTLLMYLRLLILPYDLHYYRNTDILAPNGLGFAVLGALSAALVWLICQFKINSRDMLFGLLWFLICLLPVLNIIPLINEYSLIMTAEHFLYLPMAGIMIVLVLLFKKFIPAKDLVNFGIVICLALGAISIYQNTFWRGEVALFERMESFETQFARGQLLLANAYHAQVREDKAIEHYSQALEIMKGYRKKVVNVSAIKFYDGFIKDISLALAQSLVSQGRFNEALTAYQQALLLDPRNAIILNNIAVCYIQQGDKSEAEQYLKMALGFDPGYSDARRNLERLTSSQEGPAVEIH